MTKMLAIAIVLLLTACSGARKAEAPDEKTSEAESAVESSPVILDTTQDATPRMLEGCSQSTTDAGLLLECDGFQAVLARLTHDSAITEELRLKVEHDYRAGMAQSIGGELRERALTATGPDGEVELTGFDVFHGEQHKISGMVLALRIAEKEVMTVTCLAPGDPEAAKCTAVAHEVLNRGLPDLR